jgi:hypothetical protein
VGCSPPLSRLGAILLEPVLDVPSPDDYLPAYAVMGDAVNRVVQKLKSLRPSDTEPSLELTARTKFPVVVVFRHSHTPWFANSSVLLNIKAGCAILRMKAVKAVSEIRDVNATKSE